MVEFEVLIEIIVFDVIIGIEMWINKDILLLEFFFDIYIVYRRDRGIDNYGGVFIVVYILFILLEIFFSKVVELIVVKIDLFNGK